MEIDKNELKNAIINSSGGKLDSNAIDKASAGDLSAVLSSLDDETKNKLLGALKNREAAQKILNSDAAKRLLDSFLNGGNKNG